MTTDDINEISGNCVFDTCVVGSDDTFSPVCDQAAALAQSCLSDRGILVKKWRSDDFCRELLIKPILTQ